jgi:hypothetical protein
VTTTNDREERIAQAMERCVTLSETMLTAMHHHRCTVPGSKPLDIVIAITLLVQWLMHSSELSLEAILREVCELDKLITFQVIAIKREHPETSEWN